MIVRTASGPWAIPFITDPSIVMSSARLLSALSHREKFVAPVLTTGRPPRRTDPWWTRARSAASPGTLRGAAAPSQGVTMSTIKMHATTTATPEQYIAALTDIGPGRSKIFVNSVDSELKVHRQWPNHADVTEGAGGYWERLAYDWSEPNRVVARTMDSNTWGGASGHTYTFTRNADGTT